MSDMQSKLHQRSLVGKIVQGTCECAKVRVRGNQTSCFAPFRGDEKSIMEVVSLRVDLRRLHKQDADNKAVIGRSKFGLCIQSPNNIQ